MTSFTIEGACVYLPDAIVETNVAVADGRITEVGGPAQGARVEGRGLVLAPALVDIHGDAFERQLMPRPGVYFPLDSAVLETDRQLAANGIATAYHALTLSFEPGLRSVETGRQVIDALKALAPRLTVENRVQLRWETFAFEALELLEAALDAPLAPSLAFNDHLSMCLRPADQPVQGRAFEHGAAFAPVDPSEDWLFDARFVGQARRSGQDRTAFMAMLSEVWQRRPEVVPQMERVAALAQARGIPMLSHDDTVAETRAYYRGIGARIAEFPMTEEAVTEARANGDWIAFGAPNVVRGGSHIGSLSAADMVEAGTCDMLASDYFYPAMLAAVARLDAERRAPRSDLWALVSSGPAAAMGLADRGQIAPGQRADLVLLDWPEAGPPAVRTTYVAGRVAYSAVPAGARP